MASHLPSALNAKDLVWRDHISRTLLSTVRSHTAADLWSPTSRLEGWLYFSPAALVFIGDAAVVPVVDRAATNNDRVLHVRYQDLGRAEIGEWFNRQERPLKFSDGHMWVLPMKYAKKIEKLTDTLDPDTADVEDLSDLNAVATASQAVQADEARLQEAVRAARQRGRSWNQLARALGVSRQAARQRFADRVHN